MRASPPGPQVALIDPDTREQEWVRAQAKALPKPLAGATLVRLSEGHPDCQVFTLDADFHIFRRHGNKVIPVLTPE